MPNFLSWPKIINPLGQKPAEGWFLSCVGIILRISQNLNKIFRIGFDIYLVVSLEVMASIHIVQSNMIQGHKHKYYYTFYLRSTSVLTRVAKSTDLVSADNTIYNLGRKVPVGQVTHFSNVNTKWMISINFCSLIRKTQIQ